MPARANPDAESFWSGIDIDRRDFCGALDKGVALVKEDRRAIAQRDGNEPPEFGGFALARDTGSARVRFRICDRLAAHIRSFGVARSSAATRVRSDVTRGLCGAVGEGAQRGLMNLMIQH
jgi:hypothetical protein